MCMWKGPSLWVSKLCSDLARSCVRTCYWSLLGLRGSLPLAVLMSMLTGHSEGQVLEEGAMALW